MKLIIINSTGRHRRAPSEFQSAKTIKRHEVNASQLRNRSRESSLVNRIGAEHDKQSASLPKKAHKKKKSANNNDNLVNENRFQQQARKDYRHEDSMLMYDSNVNTVQAQVQPVTSAHLRQ